MIRFTQGNLLEAEVEAVVNTVNTVGIMGKGIALMFKERFPDNFRAYERACAVGTVKIGEMFVTESKELFGPRWIINFPTKTHWRSKTRIDWVECGLRDLVRVIREKDIKSIAVPPLGCGNGGLNWKDVRPLVVKVLGEIANLETTIYVPTPQYQNVAKRTGVEMLTPARALISEIVRRYSLLGIDCSILEVQKLAWFVERGIKRTGANDPLHFSFAANKYGPYSHNLQKLLDSLDGSYLRCDKRLADAGPLDLIWFNESKKVQLNTYLTSGEGKPYYRALTWASNTISGFESPLGMELLSTVDWLVHKECVNPSSDGIIVALGHWSGGSDAGRRKLKIFDRRLIEVALEQLTAANQMPN